jgi:magnesium-transporting ATPase (P-type)
MVVFTGKDSKVMRNMVPAPRKVSQLERHMNKLVILVFLIMIIISLIMMILQTTTLDTSRLAPTLMRATSRDPASITVGSPLHSIV